MKDTIKLYSTVEKETIRRSLIYGMFPAIIGALLLTITGTFLSAEILSRWGWLLIATGLALITLGLRPYRQLSRLQTHPHTLIISDEAFQYCDQKGQPRITIPFDTIENIRYFEKDKQYGIAILLKDPPPKKVTLHTPPIDIAAHRKRAQKIANSDLFFPLFTRDSYNELTECLTCHTS